MPILVEATRRGVRCDRERLATDIAKYEDALGAVEGRIWGRLGGDTFNIGSGAELARALDSAGAVTEPRYTATGRRSTARDVLLETVSDPELRAELVYWRVLTTCLSTFMKPWLEKSIADGRLHPNWNQVRSVEKRSKGTRTGRLSSDDPNFQNLPNE